MRHRRFRIALCCFFLFLATTDSVARQNPQEDRSNRQMNTGVGLYSAGKLDAAIAAFQDAISTWPKNALAYFNLGTALADKGDSPGAMKAYEQAIALMEAPPPPGTPAIRHHAVNASLAESLNNLAVIYYQQNRLDDASTRVNHCVEQFPDHAGCLLTRGIVLQAQGKLDDAIVSYRKAYAAAPKLAVASQDLGSALQQKGALDEAEQVLRQGVGFNPQDADLQLALGSVLSAKEKFPEAQAAYQTSLQLRDNDSTAFYGLGE